MMKTTISRPARAMRPAGFLLLALLLASCNALAQNYSTTNKKAIKLFEEGYQLGMEHKDEEALKKLKQATDTDPGFGEPYLIMGQIHDEREEYDAAIENYSKALGVDSKRFAEAYSFLGDIYLRTFKFGDAVTNYEKYLNSGKIRKEETRLVFEKRLEQAYVADQLMKNPVPFDPKNLGTNINSEFSEYHPSVTADGEYMLYTVLEAADEFSCNTNDRREEDFYISRKVDGKWGPRANPGPPLNSSCNEGAANLSPDGRYIFFAATTREQENFAQGRYASMDLYYSEKSGDKWSRPVFLSAVNSDAFDSQPSFSSDGRTLYFTSNRGGGAGGNDIWFTTRNEDGTWNNPQNLGSVINTGGDEISPFIHPDNQTLYFCSNGRLGMGGYDFYMARKKADGTFDVPVNIGYPVNTPYDERSLVISSDGSTGYFASTNIEGYGGYDLYMFEMPVNSRPQPVTYLKGTIRDEKTKKPVGAEFQLIDVVSNQTVVRSSSDDINGGFLLTLPTDRQYALIITKEGYLFHSESFNITGDHSMLTPYQLDIGLQPIETGRPVVLKNIFFDTDKYDLKKESYTELEKLRDLLVKNPKLKIEISGHTDNQGGKAHNQVLSENRAKAVYDYLVANGIAASRLSYKGYGDTVPVADNNTEKGRAENRRTEFKVISVN